MQSKPSSGRHRKTSPTRALAARTAMTAGGVVAALLLAGGTATAAPAAPTAEPPCTGTTLDAIVGPVTGADCNSNPDDQDPTEPGGTPPGDPGTTPPGGDPGTTPPPPASIEADDPAPGGAALPIPCTGSPLDAFTTCGTGGHNGTGGGDRGDAVGNDTPSYGQPGGGEGENPPAE